MTTIGIRKKKSSGEVKVAVIGAPSVGKSALTVRFLTKRYIGEYEHQQDTKYQQEVSVGGETILVDILDKCPKTYDDMPSSDVVQWADAMCFVYAITDRESFTYVRRARQLLQPDVPLTLVGNKADMVHLRQVSLEEGEILAKDYECKFTEVAAAEQVDQVVQVFLDLLKEVLKLRKPTTKQSIFGQVFSLSKTSGHRAYSRGKSDSCLPKGE